MAPSKKRPLTGLGIVMEGGVSRPVPVPPVRLLDWLLYLRAEHQRGRLVVYLAEPNIERLHGITLGFQDAFWANGLADEQSREFFEWLRDVRGEFPGEGWARRCLDVCGGDHSRAIVRFLDFVAEYAELRGLRLREEPAQSPEPQPPVESTPPLFLEDSQGPHACASMASLLRVVRREDVRTGRVKAFDAQGRSFTLKLREPQVPEPLKSLVKAPLHVEPSAEVVAAEHLRWRLAQYLHARRGWELGEQWLEQASLTDLQAAAAQLVRGDSQPESTPPPSPGGRGE
jgi:hypothetical protein